VFKGVKKEEIRNWKKNGKKNENLEI